MTKEEIKLTKISEEQKNQGANKYRNRILKQTFDGQLAETFTPTTIKLTEVNESNGIHKKFLKNQILEMNHLSPFHTKNSIYRIYTTSYTKVQWPIF